MAKLTEKTFATAVTLNSLIHIVNTGDISQSAYGSSYKAELSQLVPLFGSNPDVTITGGTYNPSTGDITFYNNTGGTFNVSGFITGFTDTFISGGTYSSGTAIFNNTTGGTFSVTGFTEPFSGGSGNCITDLYLTNLHGCSPITIWDNLQSNGSSATGLTSYAFGFGTAANGDHSFAEGYTTIADGYVSHAEGYTTNASGSFSHSEGAFTTASGLYSHSENSFTIAGGDYSHAGGFSTAASGNTSFIHSYNSIVTGDRSVVIGGQNLTGSSSDTVYVPKLNIKSVNSGSSIFNLGVDSNGNVVTGSTSGTEVFVSGGTYSAGTATFRNTTGGTFTVTGFTSGDTNFANTDLTFTGNRNHDTNGNDLYIYNGLGLDGFGPNINSISIGDPRVAIGYGYYLNNVSLDIGVYNGNTGFTFTTQGVERMRMNNGGNLGIGTTSPSEKLDVSGKTKTINFQMTSGATNGYVLTSDASGNATWQASSGGVSIDPYYNSGSGATITWNVSGQSTNYKATLTATTTLDLTNVRNGDYGTIILIQDTVGSRTLTFGTVNGSSTTHRVVNGGGGSVVLTTNANAIDILTFTYDGSEMYWTVGNDYT